MKRLPLVVLLSALLAAPLAARAEENANLETLRRQAAGGDSAAQYEMGVLYEFGFRMEGNLVPALAWYMIAADGGNERAGKRRDELQGRLSAAQVEQARKLRAGLLAAAPAPAQAAPAQEPVKSSE
jgi:localization factor PodJL